MGIINPPIPILGESNALADPKVKTALEQIRDEINGLLTNANVASGADINGAKMANASIEGSTKLVNASVKAGKLDIRTGAQVGNLVTGTADHVWASVASVVPGTYLATGYIDNTPVNGSDNLRFDTSAGSATITNATITLNGARMVSAIVAVTATATVRLRGTAAAGFGAGGAMTLLGVAA